MLLSSGADTQSKRVPDLIINVSPAKRHSESVRIDIARTGAFKTPHSSSTHFVESGSIAPVLEALVRPKSAVIGVCHAFVVFDTR